MRIKQTAIAGALLCALAITSTTIPKALAVTQTEQQRQILRGHLHDALGDYLNSKNTETANRVNVTYNEFVHFEFEQRAIEADDYAARLEQQAKDQEAIATAAADKRTTVIISRYNMQQLDQQVRTGLIERNPYTANPDGTGNSYTQTAQQLRNATEAAATARQLREWANKAAAEAKQQHDALDRLTNAPVFTLKQPATPMPALTNSTPATQPTATTPTPTVIPTMQPTATLVATTKPTTAQQPAQPGAETKSPAGALRAMANALEANAAEINRTQQQTTANSAGIQRNAAQLARVERKTNQQFARLNHLVNDNRDEARAGIAGAAAMANIPTVRKDETLMVGAGLGTFHASQAVAVGASFNATDHTAVKFSVSAGTDGELTAGIGAGYGF